MLASSVGRVGILGAGVSIGCYKCRDSKKRSLLLKSRLARTKEERQVTPHRTTEMESVYV